MGHYDRKETLDLLIYVFLVNEILDGPLGDYLDDEGMTQVEKALGCLYKGCLISPVRDSVRFKQGNPDYIRGIPRKSEASEPRQSENERLRITE